MVSRVCFHQTFKEEVISILLLQNFQKEDKGILPSWFCKTVQIRLQKNPDNNLWQRQDKEETW